MFVNDEIQLDFSDVLILPRVGVIESRKDVKLTTKFSFPNTKTKWGGIPIVSSNMNTVTTYETFKVLSSKKMLSCLPKHINQDVIKKLSFYSEEDQSRVVPSTGTSNEDLQRLSTTLGMLPHVKMICLDVANGYTLKFEEVCKFLRKTYPDKILIAGNVVTKERTAHLIKDCGVDIVKLGIGSGLACTTRVVTGVGRPQLSTILDCAKAADHCGGYVMSDGGCAVSGDVVKAFAAGAGFVMLGSSLAAHEENSTFDAFGYTQHYGMSSKIANDKHANGLQNYKAPEGREVLLKSRGALKDTLNTILGGIRSACTYTGSTSLEVLPLKTQFIRVNNQLNRSLEKYEKTT